MKTRPIVYIGRYYSDIAHSNFFTGSIVAHGVTTVSKSVYSYCCDHRRLTATDKDREEKCIYIRDIMNRFMQHNPQTKFMFFAQNLFDQLLPEFNRSQFICLNSPEANSLLDSKVFSRSWLSGYCQTLPYITTTLADFDFNRIKAAFPGNNELVLQNDIGRGGIGTHIIGSEEEARGLLPKLHISTLGYQRIMVSPNIEDALHVNQQAVIFKDGLITFQPSLEIITRKDGSYRYTGMDFGTYGQDLSGSSIDFQIKQSSKKICRAISRLGYLGIVGVDYLIKDGEVYFIEVNPRFQGSSPLLSANLVACGLPDLYALNAHAFESASVNVEPSDAIREAIIRGHATYRYDRSNLDEHNIWAEQDGAYLEYDSVSPGARLYLDVSSC